MFWVWFQVQGLEWWVCVVPVSELVSSPGLLARHGGEQEGRMERTVNVSQTDLQSTSLEGEADWKAG